MLHLEYNYFNNNILSSLSGIASLKELYLEGNDFNGSIQGKPFGKILINLQRNEECLILECVNFLVSLQLIYLTKVNQSKLFESIFCYFTFSLKINESRFIFKEKVKKKKILSNNLLWSNRLVGGKPKSLHTQELSTLHSFAKQ